MATNSLLSCRWSHNNTNVWCYSCTNLTSNLATLLAELIYTRNNSVQKRFLSYQGHGTCHFFSKLILPVYIKMTIDCVLDLSELF